MPRVLTEDEILDVLAGESEIDDCHIDEADLVDFAVGKVQCPESQKVTRVESGDVKDAPNETEPEIEELELPSTSLQINEDCTKYTKKKEIKWKKRLMVDQQQLTAFVEEKIENDVGSPYSYFEKYFDKDFFTKTSYCTNLYAVFQGHTSFQPCNANEIRILFAQHIMMSCFKLPRVRMYFERRWGITLFFQNMTLNRFFALRSHLHVTDIFTRPIDCQDRLFKVRPVIDQVRRRLLQLPLEENLCVDEQMIPFKGKFIAKQYVKGKPCPWGIKVFFLCGKSGMPFDFIVYQGSTTSLNPMLMKTVGSGSAIVLELTKRIPEGSKGHKLYFDNYFPSFQLFEVLLNRGIYAAGTVRANRFANPPLPDKKTMMKRGRGSSVQCYSENGMVTFVRWFDNKVVNLASNFVGIGEEDMVQRWDKSGSKFIEVTRPEVVRLYNESMGGVDLLDQMIQYYRINIRTSKWTVRMIMHFIDLALISSWMEYRNDCVSNKVKKKDMLDSLSFRAEIAQCLLKIQQINELPNMGTSRRRGRPSRGSLGSQNVKQSEDLVEENDNSDVDDDCLPRKKRNIQVHPPKEVRKDNILHMPQFVEAKNNGRCKMPGCKKKSFIICTKCKVFLCIKRENNCFEQYHKI